MQIDKMSFAHLRQSELSALKQMLSDPRDREFVVAELIAFLSMWGANKWIDEEKIYFLGKDIYQISKPEARDAITDAVEDKVPRVIADVFLAGFQQTDEKEAQIKRPPTFSELNKLVRRIEFNLSPSMESQIEGMARRYLAYTQRTGNAGLLAAALARIGTVLVEVRGPMRPWAVNLTRRLVQEGIEWATQSQRLWILWGRSLAKLGAFEDAELLYWEGIRRFPSNAAMRSQLIVVIKRLPNRFNDALQLAVESFNLFPDSRPLAVQLAMLLAQTKIASNVSKAIDILSALLQRIDVLRFEASTVASVLVNADKANLLSEDNLRLLVDRLAEKPQRLGLVSYRLISDHKAFILAQRLWRARISLAPKDPIAWSQLAKAFASSERREDLLSGVNVLREAMLKFPDEPAIRNHLAKILAALGGDENLQEAKSLLRGTMQIDPHDTYARNQLAEILAANGSLTDRQEAIRILLGTTNIRPSDVFSRDLLKLVLEAPEGSPVVIQRTADIPPEISEDDELAAVEELSSTKELVPLNIAKWGAVRRLRFRLENGSAEEKKASEQLLAQMLQETPFAYVKLLASREGISGEAGSDSTSFAFAFERALREQDQVVLERLSERFPRLVALTIVARAVLGDEHSTAKIKNLFSAEDKTLDPTVLALKRRLKPHLRLIGGGRSPRSVISEKKAEIIIALRDANETTLPEPAIAA